MSRSIRKPNSPGQRAAWRRVRYGFVLVTLSGVMAVRGGDAPAQRDSRFFPEAVTEEHFEALKNHSPFLRSVGLSDSIILTGVANIEGDVFATLFDIETTESHLVSKTPNLQGWQLVGVLGDDADLESLTAKIQVAGGEVISIRYEELKTRPVKAQPGSGGSSGGSSGGGSSRLSSNQMTEAREAAVNYRGENPADGFPELPPPGVVQKLARMSVPQRESLNREMLELRNRGLGMDERQKIYVEKIDQTLRGR